VRTVQKNKDRFSKISLEYPFQYIRIIEKNMQHSFEHIKSVRKQLFFRMDYYKFDKQIKDMFRVVGKLELTMGRPKRQQSTMGRFEWKITSLNKSSFENCLREILYWEPTESLNKSG
jgi:hypothetical protein